MSGVTFHQRSVWHGINVMNVWIMPCQNRFNATKLLEKMRNKRLVFVGDSVNRNQWVSLVCMVEASIPDARLKMRIFNDSLISFKALVWFHRASTSYKNEHFLLAYLKLLLL
jgi:hypothetical protein